MKQEPVMNRWPHDPAEAWLPYEPSPADPWDFAKVLRMHRRLGFGATWTDAQRDLADGYEMSVTRMIDGAPTAANGRPSVQVETFCDAMFESFRLGGGELDTVSQAWLHRMIVGSFPLRERMLLGWHTHYATSNAKVRDKEALATQAAMQRKHWRGEISQLHLAMVRDEAMLSWLDGTQNRRSAPNENLARELFELFSLGLGNYTEQDIREAARALTGWQRISERQQQLKYQAVLHDASAKTIFGQTGAWKDEDLVRLIATQPAAARRIAWRLWRTFISDVDEPTPEVLEGLAASMRADNQVHVDRGLNTLVRSRLFHSSAYAGRRVLSPVEWVAMTLRTCEVFPPKVDLVEALSRTDQMGQKLFHPPNVAGWPAGKTWLTGPALVARQNFAAWLTSSEAHLPDDHWVTLAERHHVEPGDARIDFLASLLWGRAPRDEERQWLKSQQASDARDLAPLIRVLLGVSSAHLA